MTKWYEELGEDVAGNNMVSEAPDLATFVKSALDNQAHLGNSVRIPGEDASDEAVADFNQKLMDKLPGLYQMPGDDDTDGQVQLMRKLGMPEEKGGYEVGEVAGLNPEQLAAFLESAHGANMTKVQMAAMVDTINTVNGAENDAAADALKADHQALKDEWGLAYDEKIALAKAVLEEEGSPVKGMDITAVGADVVRWMADMGKRLGADGSEFTNQGDNPPAGHNTPAEAEAQYLEIMGNKEHPYWKAGDPGHQAAKDKVVKLMAEANPKAATTMDGNRAGSVLADMQQNAG